MSLLVRKTVLNEKVRSFEGRFVFFPLQEVIVLVNRQNQLVVCKCGEKVSSCDLHYKKVISIRKWNSRDPHSHEFLISVLAEVQPNDPHHCHFIKKDDTTIDIWEVFPYNRKLLPRRKLEFRIPHDKFETKNHSNEVEFLDDYVLHHCHICSYQIFEFCLRKKDGEREKNTNFKQVTKVWAKAQDLKNPFKVSFLNKSFVALETWNETKICNIHTRTTSKIDYTPRDENERVISRFLFFSEKQELQRVVLVVCHTKYDHEFLVLKFLVFCLKKLPPKLDENGVEDGKEKISKLEADLDILKMMKERLKKRKFFSVEGIGDNFAKLDRSRVIFFNNMDYFKNFIIFDISSRRIVSVCDFQPKPLQKISFVDRKKFSNFIIFNNDVFIDLISLNVKLVDFELFSPKRVNKRGSLSLEFPKKQKVVSSCKFYNDHHDILNHFEFTGNKIIQRDFYIFNNEMLTFEELNDEERRLVYFFENPEFDVELVFPNGETFSCFKALLQTSRSKIHIDRDYKGICNEEFVRLLFGRYTSKFFENVKEYQSLFRFLNLEVRENHEDVEQNFYYTSQRLYETKKFANCNLICEKSQFHVHREVLMFRSNFFHLLFKNSLFEENIGTHSLSITDLNKFELKCLLQYIYLNSIDTDDIPIIFKLLGHSHKYLERSMKRYVVSKLDRLFDKMNNNGLLEMAVLNYGYVVADDLDLYQLIYTMWRKHFHIEKIHELVYKSKRQNQQDIIEKQICNLILLQVDSKNTKKLNDLII